MPNPEFTVICKLSKMKAVSKQGEAMIYERLLFLTGPDGLLRKNLTKRPGTAPVPATDPENTGIG